MNKKRMYFIVMISILLCLLMFLIEKYIRPNYLYKSILKLSFFILPASFYLIKNKTNMMKDHLKFIRGKDFKIVLGMSISVYIVIILGYFVFKNFLDLNLIKENLMKKEGINTSNFIWVAIYISLINSFLEEYFFRGFIFLNLSKMGYKKIAMLLSSVLFSLYHIGIIDGWFKTEIFILSVVSLFIVGIVFNYLTGKYNSFLSSWMLHVFANLGINTIAFYMLGII